MGSHSIAGACNDTNGEANLRRRISILNTTVALTTDTSPLVATTYWDLFLRYSFLALSIYLYQTPDAHRSSEMPIAIQASLKTVNWK